MHTARMATFVPFNRDQTFLLPPDLKDWHPADDLAHFVLAAVERLPLTAFPVNPQAGGKPQYHPRLMLALLIYCYANGVLSSRRIERARHRELGVRCVAANLHPDHDTIAVFRRANKAAFEAAFLEVLLMARGCGLLRLGTVSIDGTKIDANASKIRSVRDNQAQTLRAKLTADIAERTAKAEAADTEDIDPQAWPAEIARARRSKCSRTGPMIAAPHRRPRLRGRSKRPGASPCRPSWRPRMPKPAMPSISRPSSRSSASSRASWASAASTFAAFAPSPASGS